MTGGDINELLAWEQQRALVFAECGLRRWRSGHPSCAQLCGLNDRVRVAQRAHGAVRCERGHGPERSSQPCVQ